MNSNALKIKLTKWVLAIGLILAFSGCETKHTIKPPSTCPQFEIYELPDKVDLSEIMATGKTDVHFDFNATISKVIVGAKGLNQKEFLDYSMENAAVSPVGLIVETIEYTSDLRTIIEKTNAEKKIHQSDQNRTKPKN